MPRICQICQRGTVSAKSRSHSMKASLRKQKINLQIKRIAGRKIRLCTACLHRLRKKDYK